MLNLIKIVVVLSTLLASTVSFSQAMSVFGGSVKARECYNNANVAGRMEFISDGLLDACDYALEHVTLDVGNRAATFVNRGIVHFALENYAAAERDYDRALTLRPEAAEIYVNRGNLFYIMNIQNEALNDYSMAIDMEIRQLHIAYFNRAMTFEKMSRYDEAEQDYRRSLELLPAWEIAENRLSGLLAKKEAATQSVE